MLERVKDLLKTKDVKYRENVNLSELSTIKIGGEAGVIVYPTSEDELVYALGVLNSARLNYRVLGRMSNVLPPDENIDYPLVKVDGLSDISIFGTSVTVGAGVPIARLAGVLARESLSGIEELSGIPGSVGGAIFGNAGAYGREISDLTESVRLYFPKTGEIVKLSASELGFSYRKSRIRDMGAVILSARLTLSEASGDVLARMCEYRERRLSSSPREPSLGSTFKRPANGYASMMIDKCGLSGFRIGGAAISEVHAGYIVNLGGASSSDVKALADVAEKCVYDKFGVRLEREIEYL